ncbi:MAG: hypothetical protein JWO98_5480 [Frankiales bacterium]|nr:hypothetical protein [Frankiales bacterium]
MPRYFLERTVGDVTRAELDAIAARSQEIRTARYAQITWEHTHVVSTPEGLKAFCLYRSPDADSVKQHAAELGLPMDHFYEVETDLEP